MTSRADMEAAVTSIYIEAGAAVDNTTLYNRAADRLGMPADAFTARQPTGTNHAMHSPATRSARWAQQTLKMRGLLERIDTGVWQLTREGKKKLTKPQRGFSLLAFSTDLGLAVWSDARDALQGLDEQITLCLTSPCYPITKGRAYGQIGQQEYVDWLSGILAGVVKRLAPGGNIALIIGQDVFEQGSPARSLYIERLTLALADRFGLHLMDRLIWHNPNKPPGPAQWASINRYQLNVSYEYVLWFTNDPACVKSDNRRVLQPHTNRHKKLLAKGGTSRHDAHSDGAYTHRPGTSYAHATAGKIPRNVMTFSSSCADQKAYKQAARNLGLPPHGAPAPLSLARFLVGFLSAPDDLVVDPMAGSFTTAKAAELEGRRWLGIEQFGEYVRGASERFANCPGLHMNPDLHTIINRPCQ